MDQDSQRERSPDIGADCFDTLREVAKTLICFVILWRIT